jgi:hypothetical protein
LARFKALQCRESRSWLHAIPSPNIGTLLDNTSFQVFIGLRGQYQITAAVSLNLLGEAGTDFQISK